jgi:deoxyxylulose-5-phosphate synthase
LPWRCIIVFDTPNDKLVWDVGHQAYAQQDFNRQTRLASYIKHMAAFRILAREDPNTTLSRGTRFDFSVGSFGNGNRRDQKKEDFHVCALIGDSSLAAEWRWKR